MSAGPDGPVALVTGAAGGIGACLVDRLVEDGHRVLATDLETGSLEEAGRDPDRVEVEPLDVTDDEAWERAIEAVRDRWGRLDLLCNVAGYLRPGRVDETPVEAIHRHVDVNAKGVMLGTRLAAPLLVASGDGHIVNIASMAGLTAVPGLGLYSASKFAVRAFSLAAAHDLEERGVAVTVVCPDAVETPMLDLQRDWKEAAITFSGSRVLSADEVAGAICGEVLETRPLELWLPRSRGWVARLTDVFPSLGFKLAGLLASRGRSRQRESG